MVVPAPPSLLAACCALAACSFALLSLRCCAATSAPAVCMVDRQRTFISAHGPSRLPPFCCPALSGMKRQDWLCLVAVHADCWLMAMTFYNAAKVGIPIRAAVAGLGGDGGTQSSMAAARRDLHSAPHAAAAACVACSSQPASMGMAVSEQQHFLSRQRRHLPCNCSWTRRGGSDCLMRSTACPLCMRLCLGGRRAGQAAWTLLSWQPSSKHAWWVLQKGTLVYCGSHA